MDGRLVALLNECGHDGAKMLAAAKSDAVGAIYAKSAEDAVVRAIDTSGRAIIFAGVTVAITLLGLTAIGIPFITGLGLAGAIVVIASVIVAIFLMPAILGLVGTRVLRWRVPGLGRDSRGEDSFWFRWGRRIQARQRHLCLFVAVDSISPASEPTTLPQILEAPSLTAPNAASADCDFARPSLRVGWACSSLARP